jgi:hypothetical protein
MYSYSFVEFPSIPMPESKEERGISSYLGDRKGYTLTQSGDDDNRMQREFADLCQTLNCRQMMHRRNILVSTAD